jgi:hypothetical protein
MDFLCAHWPILRENVFDFIQWLFYFLETLKAISSYDGAFYILIFCQFKLTCGTLKFQKKSISPIAHSITEKAA